MKFCVLLTHSYAYFDIHTLINILWSNQIKKQIKA